MPWVRASFLQLPREALLPSFVFYITQSNEPLIGVQLLPGRIQLVVRMVCAINKPSELGTLESKQTQMRPNNFSWECIKMAA